MPSLKEVDTINTAKAAAAAVAQQQESSSGGGRLLKSLSPNDDSITKNGAPTAMKTANNTSLTQQQQPSTKQQIIQYEDPSKVPPDETSFTTRPHFSTQNEFHVNLQNFDLSYRCPICYEIYTNPVVLVSCMHNFCSLCIRNHLRTTYTGMKRKADCPICNVEVKLPGTTSGYEKAIIPNKHLSQQINLYKSCGIRDEIRSSLVRLDILDQEKRLGIITKFDGGVGGMEEDELGNGKKKKRDGNEDKSLRCSKRSRRQTTSTAAAAAMKKSNDSSDDDDDDDNKDEDYKDDDNGEGEGDYNDIKNNSKMPASSSSSSTNQTTTNTKLKRKPPVSYHNMNKKKLVELCSKEGLDVTGNETQLKQRHSDFIILYNSECDSDFPRSVKELVKELRNREKHIKIEANKTIPKKQSKFMKNLSNTLGAFNDGSIDRPTSGDASFDTKLDSGFAALIANARKRKMEAAASSSSSLAVTAAAAKSVRHDDHTIVNASKSPHELTNGDKDVAAATLLMNHKVEEKDDNTITSPTGASIDSEKTVETPNKLCQMKSMKQPPKRQSSSTKTKSTTAKKKRAPKSTSASRIISYGPWTCNVCTFENLRNTSKVGPCEMCNNPRPKDTLPSITQSKDEVEVVNIDC